ncbi:MAG: phage holin family protein [Turicibacter sp.]|nr:phage holin family protein [Turicibacter sp.]
MNFLDIYKIFYAGVATGHPVFVLLFIVILLDIALGTLRAWAQNDYSSRKAREGVAQHGFLLLTISMVCPILAFIGLGAISQTFMVLLALSYLSSILANFSALGGYVPPLLERMVNEKLGAEIKSKESKKKDSE